MKYRKLGIEDYILIACAVIFILFMAYILTGCASKQTKYEVRYVKGCAIDVSVMTADAGGVILKSLDMEDCEFNGDVEDRQDAIP
jgi:hypothetical protein